MKYRKLSHNEFLNMVNFVTSELDNFTKENKLRVDYVVPNLRSGAVPAVYIANALNLVKFAPIQVKHTLDQEGNAELKVLFNPFNSLDIDKEEPVFLLVEGKHYSGNSIKICIDEIKKAYPKSKILYVSLIKAHGSLSFEKEVIFEKHALICGREDMSEDECKKLGLDSTCLIFPWENIENEKEHPDDLIENIYF